MTYTHKKTSSFMPFLSALVILIAGCTTGTTHHEPLRSTSEAGGTEETFTLKAEDITWEQTGGPEGGDFRHIEVNPDNPEQLVTGNMNSLYYSGDGGDSWNIALSDLLVQDIESSPSAPGEVYVTGQRLPDFHSVVLLSNDGGKTWKEMSSDDNIHMALHLAAAPDKAGVLYLATRDPAGVLKSRDRGKTWSRIAEFEEPFVSTIAVPREGVILLGAGGNLSGERGRFLVSADDGETWAEPELGQPDTSFVSSIIVQRDNPDRVYLGLADIYNRALRELPGNFAFTSSDGGISWKPVTDDQHSDTMVNFLDCSGPDGQTVYAAFGGALKKSTDGGMNWQDLLGQNVFSEQSMKISPMDFVDLAVHPADPATLYLPLGGAGVARSGDRGTTWNHINNGLKALSVGNMAVHPTEPEVLYAGGLPIGIPGTFRSDDRGETWQKLDGGGIYHAFTDELYVHPVDPDRIFNIADVGILFESGDRGTTWRALFDPQHGSYNPRPPKTPFRFSSVYALAVSPEDSDRVYAVKNGFGVFESTDGGQRWNYRIFSPDYTYSLAIDPRDDGAVYSGYQKKVFEEASSVYRSRVDSEEWDPLLTIPDARAVKWVELDPSNPDRVYAGVLADGDRGRIYRSGDRGTTWKVLNDQLTFTTIWGHSQLQVHPNNPEIVYTGTWGGGSYRTDDGGRNWKQMDEGHTFSPGNLQIAPSDPDILYACDRTAPLVHRSDDGGDTWRVYYDVSEDFGDEYFMTSALAVDPSDPDVIFLSAFKRPVAMGGKLLEVDPEGLIEDLGGDLPRSVLEIEIDRRNPDRIFITTHVHGLYVSGDRGTSWRRLDGISPGLPVTGYYEVDIHPGNGNILFASALSGRLPDYMMSGATVGEHLTEEGVVRNIEESAESGIYRSTDGGSTWKLVLRTSGEARGTDIDPDNPEHVAAADMTGGVWLSLDGGDNWRQVNSGLGSTSMTSVRIRGTHIYAGTQGSGVYAGTMSRSGSVSWDADRSNKPVVEVRSLQIEVDPDNPDRIYASAYPGGVLRSDDGGQSWNDKNFLTPSIRVEDPDTQGYYSLALDPADPETVWLGVYGKGMFISHDGLEYNMIANGENNTMAGKHITKVLVNPADHREVWAACEEGAFVTTDGGQSWEERNEGFHTPGVFTLAFGRDGTLYGGTRGYGVYRYNREPGTWKQCEPFGNFGRFWSTWERPLYQFSDMLIDPENPDTWYLASFPTGLYKSTDAGETWHESNTGFIEDGADGIFSITFHPHDPDTIIAGTYNGVSISTDGGAHWTRKSEGIPPEQWPFSVAVDPVNPEIMYIATKNGKDKGFHERHEEPYDFSGVVMKTTDGGESWFRIMEGLTDDNEFYNIIIHPRNRNILFLSSSWDGVFMSTDAGATWRQCNTGLENTRGAVANNVAVNLVLDCRGQYLYFGTMGGGVWRAQLY